jgi:PAS domain S-box-containing protein
VALLISLVWLALVALAVARLRPADRLTVALGGFAAGVWTIGVLAWSERARWRLPLAELTRFLHSVRSRGKMTPLRPPPPELFDLAREITILARIARQQARKIKDIGAAAGQPTAALPETPTSPALTFSGLFDAPPSDSGTFDPNLSGDYSTADMVNRLEPTAFCWIESSPAEQVFLGWTLPELRQRSFLDVLHPDDRARAQDALLSAIARGESLGLIVRVRTSEGRTRAVEVNLGARYGTNHKVSYIRCHLTDVTDKVRAERELRLRTRELTQVNEQLRRINRELEELKDRYTDLYEAAPAMYFSLDPHGNLVECNQTMLSSLNRRRAELIGQHYTSLLPPARREEFPARFRDLLEHGSIEKESQWVKSTGDVIDVWIRGTLQFGSTAALSTARFVAQDVSARRRLEAELRETNEDLAKANAELWQKNSELDEFAYAVSHDLQEPLRTLLAFSDFLQRDYGHSIGAEGQEYVRYLVDAARRMKALIQGMLVLSRAGKVIGDFAAVDLEELVRVVRSDLQELFRTRGAVLRIVGPLPAAWGDRDRLAQLLSNLICNSIKYNESPEPWVEISVATLTGGEPDGSDAELKPGNDVTICVKDNGIGIDPQFHGTIFQLFRRLHTQEEYPGTGVGLAICSKIVHAHGGKIWLESTPGKGSSFFVRLPGGPSEAPPSFAPAPRADSPSFREPSLAGSDE